MEQLWLVEKWKTTFNHLGARFQCPNDGMKKLKLLFNKIAPTHLILGAQAVECEYRNCRQVTQRLRQPRRQWQDCSPFFLIRKIREEVGLSRLGNNRKIFSSSEKRQRTVRRGEIEKLSLQILKFYGFFIYFLLYFLLLHESLDFLLRVG